MSGKLRQRRGYLRVTAIDRVQIPIRRSWGRVPGLFDWPGGDLNEVIFAMCGLAALAWLALTIPVLIAGIRQLLGWPGKRVPDSRLGRSMGRWLGAHGTDPVQSGLPAPATGL